MAFPLGTIYFVFLVAGVSLSVTLIGIPILLFVLVTSHGLVAFERELARLAPRQYARLVLSERSLQ